jgi:hypothetical protein
MGHKHIDERTLKVYAYRNNLAAHMCAFSDQDGASAKLNAHKSPALRRCAS